MLLVPLDWAAKEERHFASIAVIRLPAIVAEGDPRHGGTIITNPGGPGGSGVLDLLVNGRHVRDVVDGDKHFDIVSFDPRGTSFSRPPAKCFGDQLIRSTFAFQQRTTGSLNEGPSTLKRRLALAAAFGKVCSESSLDPGPSDDHILSQMSTVVVARDMLEIIDQLNEQAATSWPAPHESAQRPLRPHDSGPALLQYIGFSYGTHLGNTFASVYPERVQSMVLDGVVDSIDYSQGMWTKNLLDSEKVIDNFYTSCYSSNTHCALYRTGDSGADAIQARVEHFLASLSQRPLSLSHAGAAALITEEDVRNLFLLPAFEPISYYPMLASMLNDALQGNYTPIAAGISDLTLEYNTSCPSTPDENIYDAYSWGYEAALAYICNDGDELSSIPPKRVQQYVLALEELSPTFGPYWAQFGLTCTQWRMRSKDRFTGPYGRDTGKSQRLASQTHANLNPVLFLSSRLDPVTPLRNAFAMSALHPGSSVVVQDSVGHCAIFSAPSTCTKQIVGAYFAHGTMPPNVTVCEADCVPWSPKKECSNFDLPSATMQRGSPGRPSRFEHMQQNFPMLHLSSPQLGACNA